VASQSQCPFLLAASRLVARDTAITKASWPRKREGEREREGHRQHGEIGNTVRDVVFFLPSHLNYDASWD
jgi:hypothetical protein